MAGDLHSILWPFLLSQQLHSALAGLSLKAVVVLLTLGDPQASMPNAETRAAAWHLINRLSCLWHTWSVVRRDKSSEFCKVQKAQFQQWNIFTGREKRMQLPCFWNLWVFSMLQCLQPLCFHSLQLFVPDYFLPGIFLEHRRWELAFISPFALHFLLH